MQMPNLTVSDVKKSFVAKRVKSVNTAILQKKKEFNQRRGRNIARKTVLCIGIIQIVKTIQKNAIMPMELRMLYVNHVVIKDI